MNAIIRNSLPLCSKVRMGFINCRFFSEITGNNAEERIQSFVKENKLAVFMKGTPEEPMCGFSRAVCMVLDMHGVKDLKTMDVLADDSIREGIKKYSSWPTIPQVFINGEFIGGCDIVIEKHKNGELVSDLETIGITSELSKNEK